jgi:hypothetical protein
MIYLLRGYLAGHVLDQAFQDRPDQGLPARNASIESFAIHVRNVVAFLYNLKGRGSGDHHFADDYVTDIGAYRKARPRRPPALERDVVDRIHKQVAHLNYARAGYAPEERLWLYDDICLAFAPVVRSFLSYVDPAKVSPEFVDQVQRVLPPEPPSVSVGDSASPEVVIAPPTWSSSSVPPGLMLSAVALRVIWTPLTRLRPSPPSVDRSFLMVSLGSGLDSCTPIEPSPCVSMDSKIASPSDPS